MSDDKDDVRSGFIRQRRNLIIISLVLLFAETSELEIAKLNAFGNELVIRHPITVTLALVVAYLYWLYRYYVYFYDIGDIGFRNRFEARMKIVLNRWGKKKFDTDSEWRQHLIRRATDNLLAAQPENPEVKTTLDAAAGWGFVNMGVIGPIRFGQITAQTTLHPYLMKDRKPWFYNQASVQSELASRDALLIGARVGSHVLTHTRIVSEYFLPFFIAAVPALYFVYSWFAR